MVYIISCVFVCLFLIECFKLALPPSMTYNEAGIVAFVSSGFKVLKLNKKLQPIKHSCIPLRRLQFFNLYLLAYFFASHLVLSPDKNKPVRLRRMAAIFHVSCSIL